MPSSVRRILQELSFFQGLRADLLAELAANARLAGISAREQIFREGDAPERLYFLIGGLVEIYAHHVRRDVSISLVRTPDPFMVAAVMVCEPYLVSARALSQGMLLVLPSETIRAASAKSTDLSARLSRRLAHDFRHLVNTVRDLKAMTVTERLAAWILQENESQGGRGRIVLPIEKKTLASHLGVRKEVLSREFAMLRGKGVRVRGEEIEIEDVAALRDLT